MTNQKISDEAVQAATTSELTKALSRLAGNRHSDGVSSIVSADDRSVIINGCYDMMTALRSQPSPRAQALEEAGCQSVDFSKLYTHPLAKQFYDVTQTVERLNCDTTAVVNNLHCLSKAVEQEINRLSVSPDLDVTDEMLNAGQERLCQLSARTYFNDYEQTEIFKAMFDASAFRALSSQPVADGWFPIETAPKDGTPFLVFVPDDKFSDGTGVDVIWYDEERWLFGSNTPFIPANNPTHWRPLPASPGASECEVCHGTGRVGPYFPGGLSTGCGNCSPIPQKDGAK